MAADTGRYFGIGLDTKELEKSVEKGRQAFIKLTDEALKQGKVIDKVFSGQDLSASLESEFKRLGRMSIDAFGGISADAQRIMKEMQEDTLSLSNVEKMMRGLNNAYEEGSISMQEYITTSARLTVLHEQISGAIRQNEQVLRQETQQMDIVEDSIVSMQAKVALLTTEYMKLSEVQRNGAQGEELLKNISDIQTKLQTAQAAMQKYGASSISTWNGLNVSIQQIARELPALAMGPQLFFLAISNNIPMFTDALAQARKEYQMMTAAGKTATPVWKQLLSSLFSWNTALSVATTLLVVYGDDIVNWVASLFNADNAQKKLNESLTDFNTILGKSRAEADLLFQAAQRTEAGTEGRANAIREINKQYGEYLPHLLSERDSLGELEKAYDVVNKALMQNAALKARSTAIDKVLDESIKKQAEALTELRSFSEGRLGVSDASSVMGIVQSLTEDFRKAGADIEKTWRGVRDRIYHDFGDIALSGDFVNPLREYVESVFESNKDIEAIQKQFNPFFNKEEADKALIQNKEYWEEVKRQAESVISSISSEQLLKLRAGDTEGITEDIVKAYNEAVAQIKKAEANLSPYDFSQKKKKKSPVLSISVPDEEVTLITPEEIQKNIDLHREMMDKFLADYGTYQQKREAIADMYALKIAQAETEGERLSLQKQMESALKELDFEEFKGSINFADIFGNLDEQTTDALRVLRDKLASYINQAASELRPEDLKELQDAFSKLDLEIAERDPWEEMKTALQEYGDALREVNEAKEESISKTESQAKAEGKLQAAEQKRMKALSKLTTATNALGEQGIQVVNMGNQLVDMLSSFGVEVPEAVSGALDGLGQVMNGLANLDFSKPFSIITSAVSVFTGLGKTIGSLFGIGGADYSGYEEMRSQYEALLSVWDDLIAKKKEYINISYGAEAIKAAEEVQQMLDTELRTYRQLADQLLASGAGIGSHSLARRIEDRMTAEDWARVSGLVGKQLSGSVYDLFDLDPSVIGNVLNDEKTVSVLNEVNPELVEYIKNIASYEDGLKDITDALNESLTGVSFDEFQNSFVDMLSDLDATNEDFADNLEKYLQNAIFSSLVANQYKSRIQKLYNQWSDYAESGNSLTSDEADKIRQEYNQIVNDMLADRNQIMETMGWQAESSSQQQQASRGYSITASQESIDETNGRLTGIQMGVEEMKNQITIGNVNLEEIKNHAAETRDIIQSCYSELVEIRDNTGAIVKPIQTMQKDIAEMKNDIKNKM